MTRRDFHACLIGLAASLILPPAGATEWVEGRDWQNLPVPAPKDAGGRILVREFFSYGCPHCADLNPLITAWAAKLPPDVEFLRLPVSFGRTAWTALARLYFTLELDGTLARLDQAVFDAVGKQHVNLYSEAAILDWVVRQGLDPDAFKKTYTSFAVEVRLGQAQASADHFRINAVPSIIVDERYLVSGDAGRGHAGQLEIATGLIEMARARRLAGDFMGNRS